MRVKGLISDVVAILFLGFAAGSIYLSIVTTEFSDLILRLIKRKGVKNKKPFIFD